MKDPSPDAPNLLDAVMGAGEVESGGRGLTHFICRPFLKAPAHLQHQHLQPPQ